MRTQRTTFGPRRGIATIEFAVVAPVMMLLVLGTIDVTRVIQVKHYLTDAARTGCRAGTRPDATNTQIQAAVDTTVATFNIDKTDMTTTVRVNGSVANASTAKSGDSIGVTVSIPINQVAWISSLFFATNAVTSEPLTMMRH